MGMIAYAIAVAFYTLLAIWRIHRAAKREARELAAAQNLRGPTARVWWSKLARARPAKQFELSAIVEIEKVKAIIEFWFVLIFCLSLAGCKMG